MLKPHRLMAWRSWFWIASGAVERDEERPISPKVAPATVAPEKLAFVSFPGPAEKGAAQVGIDQRRTGKVSAAELGIGQIGIGQVGTGQEAIVKIDASHVGIDQRPAGQVGADQVGVGQVGIGEVAVGRRNANGIVTVGVDAGRLALASVALLD